jgi:hypothetical protein
LVAEVPPPSFTPEVVLINTPKLKFVASLVKRTK